MMPFLYLDVEFGPWNPNDDQHRSGCRHRSQEPRANAHV